MLDKLRTGIKLDDVILNALHRLGNSLPAILETEVDRISPLARGGGEYNMRLEQRGIEIHRTTAGDFIYCLGQVVNRGYAQVLVSMPENGFYIGLTPLGYTYLRRN